MVHFNPGGSRWSLQFNTSEDYELQIASSDGGTFITHYLDSRLNMPFSYIAKYETIFQRDLSDAEYAHLLLRALRNEKLQETDWWCCSDRTPTQAQLDYPNCT